MSASENLLGQKRKSLSTTYQIQSLETILYQGGPVTENLWIDLTAPDTWGRTLRVYQLMEKGERKLRIIEHNVKITEWDDIVPESDYA